MARVTLSPGLDAMVAFDGVGVRMPRRRRRKGDGRRQRLRRIAGEVRRDEVWRLQDVTLRLGAGESLAVVGGKGSGREALLRLAAGTLLPDLGTVRRREPVIAMIELARTLNRTYTVRQNIYLLGAHVGMVPDEVAEKLGWIVEFAGVEGILDRYLGAAPPLVRQRLAWSVAMATEARAYAIEQVLIVGEREFRQRCWTHVDLKREDGVSFLLASDSQRQFRRFCDRAVLLDAGRVVDETTVPDAIARLRQMRRGEAREDAADDAPGRESTGSDDGPV